MAESDNEDGGSPPPKKKFSGKKLVLFVVLPMLLLVGGGAAVMFSGILDAKTDEASKKEEKKAEDATKAAPAVFFDLPDMLVNLNVTGRRPSFLKMQISLELARQEDVPAVQQVLPRIIDNFQVYLRELRLDDLKGSAGMYRLREELLMRVNGAVEPVKVKDVLFREMLVQ
ncbi:MAG: flagellar basal body-associated FliL family protein [Azospirillaceae bacterium]|nr:flagellar basal body-associated FliL family protein [Azospirillaceae bacterium]